LYKENTLCGAGLIGYKNKQTRLFRYTVPNSKGSNNTRHIANHFKVGSALPKTRLSKSFLSLLVETS